MVRRKGLLYSIKRFLNIFVIPITTQTFLARDNYRWQTPVGFGIRFKCGRRFVSRAIGLFWGNWTGGEESVSIKHISTPAYGQETICFYFN